LFPSRTHCGLVLPVFLASSFRSNVVCELEALFVNTGFGATEGICRSIPFDLGTLGDPKGAAER